MIQLACHHLSVPDRLVNVSLSMTAGRVVHVLGENGAGKTTLLHCLAGLLGDYEGDITLNHRPLSEYAMAQLATFRCLHLQHRSTPFRLTVADVLHLHSNTADVPAVLQDALEITPFTGRIFDTLSGGEQQRVLIAQILLQVWPAIERGEALVMFDEALQGLDIRHQHQFHRLCNHLAELGNSVLVSLHDINQSSQYADDVWIMKSGELLASGEAHQVLSIENLRLAFGGNVEKINNTHGGSGFTWTTS
ncbi:ATP-binding cassette domain-containing protein [Aestuariibacter salexigens]|uniref:ATP-binding cassette domain-containing protein n=1 Tax=Aestuariibacter salexigens TaxID=226010 RepID=UPI0004142CAB|nr:ATP-binding cassette domain-containing protein [Aestuariibacter salexigens]